MKKISQHDNGYALIWAKKIRAVNLKGGKCEICGNDNFFILELHHFNADKELNSSSMYKQKWSLIEKEVEKCRLLCSNCHAEIHYDDNGRGSLKKKKIFRELEVDSCSRCGYVGKNLRSLEFHHLKNKVFNIGDFFARKIKCSVAELFDEIEKCEILCRNCHEMEHINVKKFEEMKSYIYDKVENHKELRSALDKDVIYDMYFNKGMRQSEIVKHFGCSCGTICDIIKKLKIMED